MSTGWPTDPAELRILDYAIKHSEQPTELIVGTIYNKMRDDANDLWETHGDRSTETIVRDGRPNIEVTTHHKRTPEKIQNIISWFIAHKLGTVRRNKLERRAYELFFPVVHEQKWEFIQEKLNEWERNGAFTTRYPHACSEQRFVYELLLRIHAERDCS